MKAVIILALVSLFSAQDPPKIKNSLFKCPDKKPKIGEDVCAIDSQQEGDSDHETITYIKKKCGKNEYCLEKDSNRYNKNTPSTRDQYDTIYTCQKKLKLLKIGKKCNYNAECYTGFCNGGKCATSDTCSYKKDPICGPSKYCAEDSNGNYKTCTAYKNENEVCKDEDKCAPGYDCYAESSSASSGTCKKYFSLDLGTKTNDDEFCKSTTAYGGICVEVTKVGTDCSLTYKDKDGGQEKTVSSSTDTDLIKDTDANNKPTKCRYEVIKSKDLLNKFIERYNKIKLNKLTEKKKENCGYGIDALCDEKFAELSAVMDKYDYLLDQGLIKENGDKVKDKKCEYNFWKSVTLSSGYFNVCLGLAFGLLGLLL